jgi:hypothetical protein
LYEAYDGKLIPDIFIAYCTESIFSFVSAGIEKKWLLLADTILDHLKSVDGATSGFHHQGPKGGSNNLFEGLDIDEILKNPEAWESGFGYEEHCDYFPHNPDAYDENGFAKDPERLKAFIKENMYLKQFDYGTIKHKFVR